MAVFELEKDSDVYQILKEQIRIHHPHLEEAKIVIYVNDKNKLNGQKVVIAESSKASTKLKASIDADFTITIYAMAWGNLNPEQKKACMDHELYHCGVQYVPVTEESSDSGGAAPGKKKGKKPKAKVVKDEFGRVQYTNEIKRDENGVPKWKLIPHDLEEFRNVVEHHGFWDEDLQYFKAVMDKKESS